MKKMTIGKRITFGFASVILIALLLGLFAYSRLIAIHRSTELITGDALPGLYLVTQIDSLARQNQIVTFKDVVSDSTNEMKQFEVEIAKGDQNIDTKVSDYEKTITLPKDRELFDQVKAAIPPYRQALTPVLKLSMEGKTKEAFELAKQTLDPAYDKLIAAIQAEVELNKENGDAYSKTAQSSVSSAQTGIWIGLLLSVLVGVGISYVIIRGITRVLNTVAASLNDGSNEVASASGQVSSSSQSLAEGSSEQAASIEETSSSLEEMSSMTKRNAENSRQANDLARQTRGAADKGAADMQAMSGAMAEIKNSSDEIAKIIKTIDEIAFQTNILALNAAVEAARAGEAGMGFAVVADEVRNLAQRSAQAAKETAAKIEGSISKTAQGVELSRKVSVALAEIVGKARQMDELAAEVANASNEQSQGIVQINTAVGQMDKVTQTTAANAEECASAAEELNAQAQTMQAVVRELLQLVGGAEKRPERTGPAVPKPGKKPFVKITAAHDGHGNGNGHAAKNLSPERESAPTLVADRRDEIPLDGDFKDF